MHWRDVANICLVTAPAALLFALPAFGGRSLAELSEAAKSSTVYITVEYVDHFTNTVKKQYGSGVIVSKRGDVLTAFHVVKEWFDQTQDEKDAHPLVGQIGGKHASIKIDMGLEEGEEKTDVALLQFLDHTTTYIAANVCFVQNPAVGSTLAAFGFPANGDFSPASGSFSNDGGTGGLWQVGIPLTTGMSGGPVYNDGGDVVGLIKGAMEFNANVAFVVPVAWSKNMLSSRAGVDEKCATTSGSDQVVPPPGQTCNEVMFSDMSVSPPRFDKRVICQ